MKTSRTRQNAFYMQTQVHDLQDKLAGVSEGGSSEALKKHRAKNKLTVRERIARLIDAETDFFELSALAALDVYNEALPCAGLITGLGKIHGRYCMIIANDATVKGGAYYPLTIKKHLRAQAIALKNHLPCLYLVDSGGIFLPHQAESFPDKDHFGRIFFNQACLSARGIAQIAIVMGSCTAGGAYIPAMADQCIMVKSQATLFLAGPPLVKAAIGETVSAEALGGADLHCKKAGTADYYAQNDVHALHLARQLISALPDNKQTLPFKRNQNNFAKPLYPPKAIYGLIPKDPREFYDLRDIILCVTDSSAFTEFKALYGTSLVCGFGEIGGFSVGILANNGVLTSEAALKGTHFIQLCCQQQKPLIFFQNVTGFQVGRHAEQEGIAKNGAKMVMAVACANVPKITVIMGNSFGAGNYAMCGRAFDPHFLFTWPNARIGVMGGEQAAEVLTHIGAFKKSNNINKAALLEAYEKQNSAYYATARLWDDGIIDPAQTRQVLGIALEACQGMPVQRTVWGVMRF